MKVLKGQQGTFPATKGERLKFIQDMIPTFLQCKPTRTQTTAVLKAAGLTGLSTMKAPELDALSYSSAGEKRPRAQC